MSSATVISGGINLFRRRNVRSPMASLRRYRKNNVRLMYWHILSFTIYQSICQWNLFDAYLSFLAKEKGFVNSNTWVGFAEGIMGVTALVLAIPLGVLVDTFDRIGLLKIAACIGFVATAISAYAFMFDHLTTLYANLFLWGIFTGLQGTAAEAVFADSVEKGKRSEKFTFKGVLNTCGLSLGPLLMLGLFIYLGDNWKLPQLHVPLLVGCCFAPLCCIPLFFMKDPKPNAMFDSNGQISMLRTPLLSNTRKTTPLLTPTSPILRRDRIGSHFSDFGEVDSPSVLPERANAFERSSFDALRLEVNTEEERFKRMSLGERCIPFILTTSDFITEVGAGMTVRFFPLFFITDYYVSPIALCAIFCVYPLCVSVAMPLCQKLSVKIGRAHASFAFQTLGIFMLLLMTCVNNLTWLIIVFMLRGQLQNAAYPVDRSILMDYVPSKHRGKWNSIASLATMTWSGSAVLGGYLADRHDYRFTFLITAGIYSVGVIAYLPLLWLVPVKECGDSNNSTPTRPVSKSCRSHGHTMDTLEETPTLAESSTTRSTATLSPLSPGTPYHELRNLEEK